MPLAAGDRIGPYEILSELGAGGMGEVYRARDSKLNRDVAIKVLPDLVATDPDRLARFHREAQALAALNHPNIAQIYGFGDDDLRRSVRDTREGNGPSASGVGVGPHASYLVLEFVDGPTLADMLARSPLPYAEAISIASQVAEALEAAHLSGIIHRDLKPANIKVTPDGKVKVLDFGLAKLTDPGSGVQTSAPGLNTMSPTLSVHATYAGVILGTASYMSPEQAKGRPVDKRTDVWAFGCVLYEMLTGQRAFDGEDVTDAIAAVVRGDPDWSKLPPDVPAHIRTLLRRCVEKDRTARVSDISTARFVLAESMALPAAPSSASAPAGVSQRRAWTIAGTAAGAAVVVTAAAAWGLFRPGAPPPRSQTIRFAIEPSSAQALAPTANHRLAISPDGARIAYVGSADRGLLLRSVDQVEAVPLRGVTSASWPFFSPDGEWIGFFDLTANELKKVPISGGPPVVICRIVGAPRGATWGSDHRIVFATYLTGLFSVSDGGGDPTALTKRSPTGVDPVFPSLLPDGRSVLLTVPQVSSQIENAQVAVLDLQTGQQKVLVQNGSNAEYLASASGGPGYLVYAVSGALRAVGFDPGRLEMVGSPIPLNEQVTKLAMGASEFALSRTGSLVYAPGGEGDPRSLVWVTRQGGQTPLKAPARTYQYPRISPDGSQIAVSIVDQERDIWIWDVARENLRRLTIDPGVDQYPLWTTDGQRIVFSSTRAGGVLNAYWQRADGTGVVEQLFPASPNTQVPMSIHGTDLISIETKAEIDLTRFQLGAPGQGPKKPEVLLQTQYAEAQGEISPDGRWLAYISNESGRYRVYVVPYPNVKDGRWEISPGAGVQPVWSKRGDEIFYYSASEGAIVAVPVRTGSTFSYGNPVKLFNWNVLPTPGRPWDISSDAQRFLMIKEGADQTPSAPSGLIVVVNWLEELKQRVPTR